MTNSTVLQTSSSLNAQIDKAKAEHRQLTARLPAFESQRDEALLMDDTPAVEEADRTLAAARTQLGRLSERLALLSKRLSAIVDAEENEAAAQLREKAQAVCDAGVAMLKTEYVRLAAPLAKLLAKLAGAEEFIREVNRKVGERVSQVDAIGKAAGRFEPEASHVEIEKWWQYQNFPEYFGTRVRSRDGSACPPRPEKRPLEQDAEGIWSFDEPVLREKKVVVIDRHTRHGDDIEMLFNMIPAIGLDEDPLWNKQCLDVARADCERLAEELLLAYGSPDRPAKRARNALAA